MRVCLRKALAQLNQHFHVTLEGSVESVNVSVCVYSLQSSPGVAVRNEC